MADQRRSEGDQSTGSHSRDGRGLVLASFGAPGDIRSAVLEAADLTVPTTAPVPTYPDRGVCGTSAHPTGLRSGLSFR